MTPNSSLLKWLNTFQLDGKNAAEPEKDAYYNLADGYVCARILNQISPPYFSDKWLDGIKPVAPNGSWRLRVSNLKRILQKIYDYASDLQSPQFRPPSAITPDVSVIAQNFDPDQICRLIQLILFCAISCDKKQDYIEKIRDLPTEVKQDIKEAIEELLIKNDENLTRNTTSRLKNDSINSENDTSNLSQKQLNNSSISQTSTATPIRLGNARHSMSTSRRDSTPGGDPHKRNESCLNISSQSYYSDHKDEITTVEHLRQRLETALALQDEKAQACHELESKLKQIQMERDQLAYENERLLNESNSSQMRQIESHRQSRGNLNIESSSDALQDHGDDRNRSNNIVGHDQQSQEMALQQNKRLQIELQQLKEEIFKLETEKEEHRLNANILKEDLNRVTMRHEELRDKADQAKRLQDELDEHKHISEKVVSYENIVENLKKKNNDMKRELKSLEEKNLVHVQNIVRLEEEKSQLANNVSQIEIFRRQLNETRVKLSQETHRADKAEVELARLTERYELTKKDYARLTETTNQLIRVNSSEGRAGEDDGNRYERTNFNNLVQTDHDQDNLNSISGISIMELKEKIARLKTENELLQAKLNSKQENNKSILNGLLEEATEKCKRLEGENRQSRKKIMMLESNLKDLMNGEGVATAGSVTGGLVGQLVSTGGGSSNQQTMGQPADSSSDNVLMLIKRIEDQQRLLYQREQELRDSEAKYRRHIQKAKDAIQALNTNQSLNASLHPSCMSSTSSFTSNSLDETNMLRHQLREREERIIQLEREFYEFKKLKEVHERLILSAFYGLTTQMQWKNAEKRLERSTITSPPNTASSSMNMHSKHSH